MTESTTIDCPKCHESMRELKVDDYHVDRCENCYGIWVDGDERTKLRAAKSTIKVMDIGPAEEGKVFDKITEIDCPRCNMTMMHRQHPDQKHISFEECRECRGCYFDAGELKDLATFSLGDVFRMFTKK